MERSLKLIGTLHIDARWGKKWKGTLESDYRTTDGPVRQDQAQAGRELRTLRAGKHPGKLNQGLLKWARDLTQRLVLAFSDSPSTEYPSDWETERGQRNLSARLTCYMNLAHRSNGLKVWDIDHEVSISKYLLSVLTKFFEVIIYCPMPRLVF